jgi:hypothetical protein
MIATVKPPPGKLQRRIWRQFVISPNALLTTTQLMRGCYPRMADAFRNWHRWDVRRAAVAVAVPVGRSTSGRGRPLLWKAKDSR